MPLTTRSMEKKLLPEAGGHSGRKGFGRSCPKVPQLISHYSGFNNVDEPTDAFLRGLTAFGKHPGPIFLQLSEKHSPANQQSFFIICVPCQRTLLFSGSASPRLARVVSKEASLR